MAQIIADRRDVDFVLHELFEISELSKHEPFVDFNKNIIDMIITEARNLAIKEILPTMKIGDKAGARYENGKVLLPAEFNRAWNFLKRVNGLLQLRTRNKEGEEYLSRCKNQQSCRKSGRWC